MSAETHQVTNSIGKTMRIFLLVATVVILSITIYLTLKKPPPIDRIALQQEVQTIQQKLPLRVDPFTELREVKVEDLNITYSFLVTTDPTQEQQVDITSNDFAKKIELAVKNNACLNKNTKRYLNSNVSLLYRYTDSNDHSIASFDIPAGFCK